MADIGNTGSDMRQRIKEVANELRDMEQKLNEIINLGGDSQSSDSSNM